MDSRSITELFSTNAKNLICRSSTSISIRHACLAIGYGYTVLTQSTTEPDSTLPLSINDEGLLVWPGGKVWIPRDDRDIQLCLCVVARTGSGGHRRVKATHLTIKDIYLGANVGGC
jgi:hypothetical protein